MIRPIHNSYNFVLNAGKRKNAGASNIKQEEAPVRSENRDVVEISREEKGIPETASQTDAEEKILLNDPIAGEITQEASEILEEGETAQEASEILKEGETAQAASESLKEGETTQAASESLEEESTRSSGKVGINAGKLARMLAAAKTQEQIQAVIAKIKQDLKECEAGKAQGMDVDEASVQAAQNMLDQANQRMSEAANREATPAEEMAFSLAGLM